MLYRAGVGEGRRARRLWAVAFLAGAVAALAGGAVHGFAPWLSPFAHDVLWKTVLVATGLAGSLILAGTVLATLTGRWRGALLTGAAGQLALYLALVAGSNDVRLAVWNGAITIVALLGRRPRHGVPRPSPPGLDPARPGTLGGRARRPAERAGGGLPQPQRPLPRAPDGGPLALLPRGPAPPRPRRRAPRASPLTARPAPIATFRSRRRRGVGVVVCPRRGARRGGTHELDPYRRSPASPPESSPGSPTSSCTASSWRPTYQRLSQVYSQTAANPAKFLRGRRSRSCFTAALLFARSRGQLGRGLEGRAHLRVLPRPRAVLPCASTTPW